MKENTYFFCKHNINITDDILSSTKPSVIYMVIYFLFILLNLLK